MTISIMSSSPIQFDQKSIEKAISADEGNTQSERKAVKSAARDSDAESSSAELTPKANEFGGLSPVSSNLQGCNGVAQSDSHDGALDEEEQSPYLDTYHQTRDSRRGRLSIDNLIRPEDTKERPRISAQEDTGKASETAQFGVSLHGTTRYIEPKSSNTDKARSQGDTSMESSSSSFADDSLAALANASQAADISSAHSSFLSLDESGMYQSSPAQSIPMQHSASLSNLNIGSSQGAPGTGLEQQQQQQQYGRTRSGTVRRYPSSNSTSSAPPFMGDATGMVAENISNQESSANASPFLPSGSASDSASGQGSPSYNRTNISAITSGSPNFNVFAAPWTGQQQGGFPEASSSRPTSSRSGADQQGLGRKKRNKCSPEQYRQLEAFFAKNRNPTGKVREELSKRIKMPERSVQVWFQNKRAKTKLNEIKEGVPPEQRTTVSRPKLQRSATGSGDSKKRRTSNSHEHVPGAGEQGTSQEESVIPLPASSLCVGEWRRIKPLICLFSRRNLGFTWYLSSESVGFKLETPRNSVKSITFNGPRNPTMHEFGEGINTPLGHLVIELERPPQFYMEVFRSSGRDDESSNVQKASWRQCSDFTEGKQATNVMTHIVCGPYAPLRNAAIQLQQTGGAIGQLVQFQDRAMSGPQSAAWPESFHDVMHPQQQSHDSMLPYGTQPIGQSHSTMTSSSEMTGAGHQQAWPTASSSSPWVPDVNAGQGHPSHLRFGSSSQQMGYPATPHSATSLDLSHLRLDTPGLSSSYEAGMGSAQQAHGLPAAAPSHSGYGLPQWPQTASHAAPPWSSSFVAPSSSAGHGRYDPMHASGAASAPPYQAQGFEQQQERINLHHTQSPTSHFFQGGNPMGGVGCGPLAGPSGDVSSNMFAQDDQYRANDGEHGSGHSGSV